MTEPLSRRQRIMLVDDEPANLKLLERMLRRQGYDDLVIVQDAREVRARSRRTTPDLILLDLKMPHKDGYEVLQELREDGDPLAPPVIVLTAQPDKESTLRALSAGARDFLAKPFDHSELLMRVRNLLDAHLAHRLLQDGKATLEEMVRERTAQLEATRLQIVQRLGRASEYRDEETGSHILRMSHYCMILARGCGWSEDGCQRILHASPMHDLGKIGIPDAILQKPGRLTPEEWAIMKSHAEIGAKLLEGDDSGLLVMSREIALTHHEKWDGSGYPNGVRGESIPQSGRIAALADVFDALTSERPYKRAWSLDEALDFIAEQRGRHFDPALVDLFMDRLSDILAVKARFAEPRAA
ncbi:MAG: response regulator [Marivibrio sp.]|uniref:HD-GYP domain-containing protein n=1 Tax=Marivibrio sp. TaxID=2039719 RepID=UPI0032F00A7B